MLRSCAAVLSRARRIGIFYELLGGSDQVGNCIPENAGLTWREMISVTPPLPTASGTAPAAMASTTLIPKCSTRSGSFSSFTPKPVACQ